MREREIDNGTVVELTAANKFERRQTASSFSSSSSIPGPRFLGRRGEGEDDLIST